MTNKTPLKYCTYLTVYHGNKMPMYYIGHALTTNVVFCNYRGSAQSKSYGQIWDFETKNNPHLFKTQILTYHDDKESASEREGFFQTHFQAHKNPMYINMCIGHKKFNVPIMSDETKLKISKANKGKFVSAEARRNMSIASKKKKHSEETKLKFKSNWAKISPEERSIKMKKVRQNQICTKETKLKMSNSQKGRIHSNETKLKMSVASKGKPKSKEQCLKNSEIHKGRKFWNNGIINKKQKECPGEGFVLGLLIIPKITE